jgi:hypothetical protein
MNDKDTPFIVLGIVALYVFYKISLNNTTVKLTTLADQQANNNNPWLTVPGAIGSGLVGIGSLLNSFDDLFTDNSINSD